MTQFNKVAGAYVMAATLLGLLSLVV